MSKQTDKQQNDSAMQDVKETQHVHGKAHGQHQAHEQAHGHEHQHEHHHEHSHGQHQHGHGHAHSDEKKKEGRILTIRSHSGLSGDMLLAGLLYMTETEEAAINALLSDILPELSGTVRLERKMVNQIGGWHASVNLPQVHEHRSLADIVSLIDRSRMEKAAKTLAIEVFTLLARAEAKVHGKKPEDVHFHEVGALDSILDICMVCALFVRLAPTHFVVSPLPVGDGGVFCAHGHIPVPAPAVLELLEGIPVRSFGADGGTVTPTAIALLPGV